LINSNKAESYCSRESDMKYYNKKYNSDITALQLIKNLFSDSPIVSFLNILTEANDNFIMK